MQIKYYTAAWLTKMKVFVIIFCLVLVCISTVFGAVIRQNAPMTDEDLIKQGYSCKSDKFVLMKNGEVNNNPSKNTCRRIRCANGQITHHTCGIAIGPCIGPGDKTKPYPDCCFSDIC